MSRHLSRELALQMLFQTEFSPELPIQEFLEVFEQSYDQDVIDYSEMLINGVKNNRQDIDQKMKSTSKNWSIERMSVVDRNIIRLSIYEMKMMPEPLKANIVINEAVNLAKKYGTSESATFVNGILDQIANA